MPEIKLDAFKGVVKDAARPNRFFMTIEQIGAEGGDGPQNSAQIPNWDENHCYLVKSAGLPPRTIGEVELNWQGMKAKLSGDPTYDEMTITLINDYDFKAKKFFESWLEVIAMTEENTRSSQGRYKANIKLDQLGRTGEIIASYRLHGAWPKQMDQIELSHESTDTIEELSMTIQLDYWLPIS